MRSKPYQSANLSRVVVSLVAIAAFGAGARSETPGRPAIREVRAIDGRTLPIVPPSGGATAVIFYSTECPISNEYTPKLNALAGAFPAAAFSMVGVCVDPDLPEADVTRHAREYGFQFPVCLDRDGSIAARLGARVTPQAVVIDAEGKGASKNKSALSVIVAL